LDRAQIFTWVSRGFFLGVLLKMLLDTPSILSGHTKDHTRVPAQEVHNFWSDGWIVLKFLQEFPKALFVGIAMKSLLDAPNIWLGQTTNQTRILDQKVFNSWSDRWIVLNFLQAFPKAVFLVVVIKLLLDTPNILSGHTKDQKRLLAQEVHNFWSDHWIGLQCLQEFQEACFLGVTMKSPYDVGGVWLGQTTDRTRVLAQDTHYFDLTIGSGSNVYRSFKRLVSLASQWNRQTT
jgi:hypothetical protein